MIRIPGSKKGRRSCQMKSVKTVRALEKSLNKSVMTAAEKSAAQLAEARAPGLTQWLADYRESVKKLRQQQPSSTLRHSVAIPGSREGFTQEVELTLIGEDRKFMPWALHCPLHGFRPVLRKIHVGNKSQFRCECGHDLTDAKGKEPCPFSQQEFRNDNHSPVYLWNTAITLAAA